MASILLGPVSSREKKFKEMKGWPKMARIGQREGERGESRRSLPFEIWQRPREEQRGGRERGGEQEVITF
jgi:hypothetical protein